MSDALALARRSRPTSWRRSERRTFCAIIESDGGDSEQRDGARVDHGCIGLDHRERREPMRTRPPVRADVPNLPARREHPVGDQPPVAVPPQRLGAHDGGPTAQRQSTQFAQGLRELGAQRVVGVAAKRRVAPCGVRRVGMWMPPSTQASEVTVIDPTILQRPRKGLRGELRVAFLDGTPAQRLQWGHGSVAVENAGPAGTGTAGVSGGPAASMGPRLGRRGE